jgi:uncharacterized spore protein YtfJ
MTEQALDDVHFTQETQSLSVIQDTMSTFLEAASVDAVYGEPTQAGDQLVIPTAEVLSFMGFGLGTGAGINEGEGDAKNVGHGSGGGAGGRILSRPVAVIVASPEGVRVEPVLDITKIALATLTAAGFMIGMIARMRSPRRVVG